MKNNIAYSQGSTLIEVLIALIILSIGLLGISGLQTQAQQFNRGAYLNTQATFFAHDMLEKVRANPEGKKLSFYNKPASTEHASCFSLAGCNSQEIAENDMFEWGERIAKSLPKGSSVVCIDSTPNDGEPSSLSCDGVGAVYAVKIWWLKMDSSFQRVVITAAL